MVLGLWSLVLELVVELVVEMKKPDETKKADEANEPSRRGACCALGAMALLRGRWARRPTRERLMAVAWAGQRPSRRLARGSALARRRRCRL